MKNIAISLACFLSLLLFPIIVQADQDDWQDETIYYILVDRFMNNTNSNDFEVDINDPTAYHGGDLQGITEKLDYIKQLGFTTINLSPVMSNETNGYHGFWIEDYQSVEEHFGTMDDLRNLVNEAHNKDLKVILDFVVTHTGPNHPWATMDRDWTAGVTNNPWGNELPVPNFENPEVESYLIDTATYWMNEADIDGFRVYTNDSTPTTFIEKLTEEVQRIDSNSLVIIDDEAERNIEASKVDRSIAGQAKQIFSNAGNQVSPLLETWDTNQSNFNGNIIDSVDTIRLSREAVKSGYNPTTHWKLALTYLYTVPGIPIVYQGTEVPLDNGEDVPDHQMAQLNNGEDELSQHMEQLAAIRKQFPAITRGDFDYIASTGAMSVYKRTYQEESVYVAINNDTVTQNITLSDIETNQQLTGLLQDNIVRPLDNGEFKIALDRESAEIFIVEENKGLNWMFIGLMIVVLGGFVAFIVMMSIKNRRTSSEN